jgi:tetratricopeptide (TPR) repeat protein
MPSLSISQALQNAEQLRAARRLVESEDLYRKILAASPDNIPALNGLGMCLGDAKRMSESVGVFKSITQIDPAYHDAWANYSLAAERLEDYDQAIAARRRAIELRPDLAENWHRLGTCLGKSSQFTEAAEALQKARDLDPSDNTIPHDLVLALGRGNQLDRALIVLFEYIHATGKVDCETVRCAADCLKSSGRFQEATDLWGKVLEIDPTCSEARGQWSMCLITLGDYEKGWLNYESRWDCETFQGNVRRDPSRQWGAPPTGRPDVAGKTILIYGEQGIGDTIHFIRYASQFAKMGARVIVQVAWPLKSLLQKCDGVRLAYALSEQLPAYDWHIPMMSLPHAFGTILETIPAPVPYLHVDPSLRKSWLPRVESAAPRGTSLRVGLAWAGNPKHKNDVNRSIDSSLLSPLAQIPNVTFFTLQKFNENEKAVIPPPNLRLVDFIPSLHDFADTAALIEQLDLVISVDTAVVHLAGALGKPVWTMLPFTADFRWGLRGEQSPWYPTMRLFRQPKFRSWPPVIENVVAALREFKPGGFTPPRP